MELIIVLFVLFVLLAIITVTGHVIWIVLAAILRWVFKPQPPPPARVVDLPDDLTDAERQIVWSVIARLRAERTPKTTDKIVIESVPSVSPPEPEPEPEPEPYIPPPPPPPPPRAPRRPFSEVLNSFMEESNIRWGEIIGGLLIIGCSTALVVSLWAQISQIPVLKFLIFTTVTAVLFGVGLYTEHRWKLPTTSRGILTIATLLVPLNFLAIAAVSASNMSGALVIGSELAAPAIFLCLVYFAGRVITPGCAHILSAGVLGSSIGQLLVRHFAAPDASPALLVFLGAFPVLCYVVTVGLALRLVLADREIDESETTTVFTILGTMSFAALLPFGLLLYKAGPLGVTMMYLAPIVTLWGLPMLATGAVLWRRIKNRELVASRTTGTALGILGVVIVLAGMILAWPNPASIIPAALLNFAIFTALAIVLELPVANLIAAFCLALAYVVAFHVFAGRIPWENLRVMSLLQVSLSVSSGQALAGAFVAFVLASEWLSKKRRVRDSYFYLMAACLLAAVSVALVVLLGVRSPENHSLWIVFGIYSLGAFWIAWREKSAEFTWIGSTLLLFTLADGFGRSLSFSFPWQTALLAHATICATAAIISLRYFRGEILSKPLNNSALITLVFGVVSLFQANTWEVTAMQAQRVFWIAGILFLLLWLNRQRILFHAFQIALICAVVLTVKAALQQYEWYSYLPHAFLHPSALQIYGTVLAVLCLTWIALRLLVERAHRRNAKSEEAQSGRGQRPRESGGGAQGLPPSQPGLGESWTEDAWRLLDTNSSIDRILSWALIPAFLLLAVYGSLAGVTQELAAWGSGYPGFNIAGFPHQEALALGSWIVLGLLTVLMLANFWERRHAAYLLGAVAVLSAAIPLLAGTFEPDVATATAWRWLAAFFLLGGSVVLWYRARVWRWLQGLGWPRVEAGGAELASYMRVLLITLTVLPLLFLTLYPALRAIYYLPIQGPTGGIFALFADDVSYGIPLVLVAIVMVGYALREKMPEFSFYGGFLLNTTVTLAFLLAVVAGKGLMDRAVLIRLVQLNAITFAVYSLAWLSTRRRWQANLNEAGVKLADYLLNLQVWLAIALNVLLILPVALGLVIEPEPAGHGTIVAGTLLGWLALATTFAATTWLARAQVRSLSPVTLAGALMAVTCLTAFSVADISGWFALHVLTVCATLSAWLMLAAASFTSDHLPLRWRDVLLLAEDWPARCRQLAAVIGGIAAFLSLRTAVDTGPSGWWSVGPLLALTALAATLNWQTYRRRYIYAAAILFNLAASLWCLFILQPNFNTFLHQFFLTNLIAGCLLGILWLWLELRSRRLRGETLNPALSVHNLVAVGWFLLFAFVVLGSLAEWAIPFLYLPRLSWLGWASLLALMTACLWDRHAKYAVAGLYLLGVVAIALALQHLDLPDDRLTWEGTILLGIYAVGATLVWHWRERFITLAQRFGVPRRLEPGAAELAWLVGFSIVSTFAVIGLAYWIDLRFLSFGLRSTAALAVIAQFVTFGLLAEGTWERRWQRVAIAVLVAGAVLFGWSWLTPGIDGTWLNRSVILMLLAFGLTAVYGLLLKQAKAYSPGWTSAAQSCVPALLGAGVVALFFCLGTEIFYQVSFGAVRIHPVSLIAIGVTLIAAIVICVLFALSPQHDPLGLSERGRMNYVYAAEVMLALLFLHIRLTMPWLFTGFIERYWPLAVMVIAYLGVVTSESLRRRRLLVLAQPLERTGVFLPLLPVLGFWLAASEVDFSLLLFVVGGLYGLLSILRRSFVFGILAAVAGNGALWYVLHRTDDYQLLQHPQLWLIPIALSALLAAYLNEENLTEDQMAGVRYLSLVTIYVSSTADIFINGVANSPWLPLILGSFSLAGVFAGIIFRIRGLLLLGSVFLLLSIITMIWYASANLGWTWLWYVAGIVTGATIIFMFAVFEKKRSEVLRLVEGLKEWER